MLVSAEIRWFWRSAPPPGLEGWFCKAESHGCPAGGGRIRVDEYLRELGQVELGLKRRGGKKGVEVKGLLAVTWGGLATGPFAGPIELWTKWTSEQLELDSKSTVATEKQRWLRKFDTALPWPQEIPLDEDEKPAAQRPPPTLGCNVELTRVKLPQGDIWWTLGFEAFGRLRTVESDLQAVATILATRRPPPLGEGLLSSYPAWLNGHAGER
jgi:hypothetical protein